MQICSLCLKFIILMLLFLFRERGRPVRIKGTSRTRFPGSADVSSASRERPVPVSYAWFIVYLYRRLTPSTGLDLSVLSWDRGRPVRIKGTSRTRFPGSADVSSASRGRPVPVSYAWFTVYLYRRLTPSNDLDLLDFYPTLL